MKSKRFIKRLVAIMCVLIMVVTSLNVGTISTKAATSIDLTPYMTTSGSATATVLSSGQKPAVELNINLPEALNEKSEFQSAGVKSLSVTFTVSSYTAYSGETAGAMAYFMDNSSWTWNAGSWVNLSSGSVTATLDISSVNWGSGTKVGKIGIQLCNLAEGSTVTYKITSASLVADSNPLTEGSTGGSEGGVGGSVAAPDDNYAKLLQYSLYFYDANMCGDEVGENSLLSWRGDCHTYDKYTYRRSDGSSVTVDLTGGFHDAGDHVKFGLPEAYAAFTLGMSYDTNTSAYESAKQVEHLKTITTHFSDYLVDCAVLNSSGTAVEAFCVQVGQGGGGYDHGYWGAPEAQPQNNRTAYFSSASAPHTDIVSLSAAALAMQYKNFGGDEYLKTAKLLFAYAKNNNKSVGTTSSTFYVSSNWEDDYCLAALLLYQITGDSSYKTEYDKYKSASAAMKPYWPLGWDNVGPAVAYYAGDSGKLYTLMNIGNGTTFADGYRCIDNWGSARYNTSMQYTGLLYDDMTGTNSYKTWAEGQMGYLLGDNSYNKCFVVGYNSNSAKYPHHRAASGYTGGDKGTTAQKYVLMGALVGGPKSDGSYVDSASDYVCNEVAIDYNATLVAAAAAHYENNMSDTAKQVIDSNYHQDSGAPVWTTQTAPAAPTKKSATTNTIVLNTIAGCEYSKDGKNWQSSTTFSGLSANTEYTFYARKAEDATNYLKASPASAGTKIKTSPILVTGITLSKKDATINDIGDSVTLTADVSPSNASNKTVTWSSSNSAIASVSNGKVTAKGTGVATITAKANDGSGKTATCTVTVYDTPDAPAATDAVVNKYTTDTITLNYIQGCEYSKDGVNWQDSNVFTGLEPGKEYTFYVRVKGDDKYIKDGAYTIVKASTLKQDEKVVPVTGIAFDNKVSSSCKLAIGEAPSWTFKASVTPANATQKGVTYSSSNDKVLTIDENGVVKAVAPGKATITAASVEGGYSDTIDIEIYKPFVAPEIDVYYRTHIQNVGWEGTESNIKTWKKDGVMSGTSGRALRLEGINIVVTPETACPELDLGIQYTTHCQDYGWLPWSADGEMNGTEGESKRLEAIEIQLTGEHKDLYDVYYRVHAQDFGWLGWAKNGEPSGTAGKAKRLEGIQIVVVKKGTGFNRDMEGLVSDVNSPFVAAPGSSPIVNYPSTSNQKPVIPGDNKPNVVYQTHVQYDGWQCWKYNGQMSGTSGRSLRLEGIHIKLTNRPCDGGIVYTTHVSYDGWQGDINRPDTWRANGQMAGTEGESKRLEAICIALTGEMADKYDVYYRVHAQDYGWLGWACNGAPAGTAGYSKRLEGIQIVLVEKGDSAPSNDYGGLSANDTREYIEKK
ncbi:MAG: glycoside hydrolase family 9 protein [Lachnospiraceae bacterium]|nr:glycoside hydrolase family 9 protein [Lachnospiraceae bacterium]